jgi:hypothetical protein
MVASSAFWGTIFQVAVGPFRWAVEKGHGLRKTVCHQMESKVSRIEIMGPEAEPLNQVEQPATLAQPTRMFNNLDRLLNWSDNFVGRRQNGEDLGGHIYPAPLQANAPGNVDIEASRPSEVYHMRIIRRAPEP